LGIPTPTSFQQSAISSVLYGLEGAQPQEDQDKDKDKDYSHKGARRQVVNVVGAQTGTGKTLSYLVPVIEGLKRDEPLQTRPLRPRALVVVPTRELADQVLRILKALAHKVKFRAGVLGSSTFRGMEKRVLGGGRNPQTAHHKANLKREQKAEPMDILVATPGVLTRLVQPELRALYLTDVKYLVLDELDSLVADDEGLFKDVVKPLAARSRRRGAEQGSVLMMGVGASFSPSTKHMLTNEVFPARAFDVQYLLQDGLHHTLANCQQTFLRIGEQDKLDMLVSKQVLLNPKFDDNNKAMVFCNSVASCRAVDHYLTEQGFACISYHGAIPASYRSTNWQKFLTGDEAQILVTTDVASRGLDTTCVSLVVLFDFPFTPVDYLHRVGRTARAGRSGHAVSLLKKSDYVLADAIEASNRVKRGIESLSNDKRAYTNSDLFEKKRGGRRGKSDVKAGDFRVQTHPWHMKTRARVSGGGEAWMPDNVYQAYMNRRQQALHPSKRRDVLDRVKAQKIGQKRSKTRKDTRFDKKRARQSKQILNFKEAASRPKRR
jgi:superfamily II DNA/RNA helicase